MIELFFSVQIQKRMEEERTAFEKERVRIDYWLSDRQSIVF